MGGANESDHPGRGYVRHRTDGGQIVSSGHYSTRADVSAIRRTGGGGMVIAHQFLCGHQGSATGSTIRNLGAGKQFLRCAACTAKGKK
jgi:hypothetical protein